MTLRALPQPARPGDRWPPPTLMTHYVRDVFDIGEPALCQQARGVRRRSPENSLPYGHWYTAARPRVTCPECLDWLHA